MFIKKLKVSNFKSFKDIEIDIDRMNVVIGPNAAGKSNFVQVFKFLRDMVEHDIQDAVYMQGGVEFFRNVRLGDEESFLLELVIAVGNQKSSLTVDEINYKIEVGFEPLTGLIIFTEEVSAEIIKGGKQDLIKVRNENGEMQINSADSLDFILRSKSDSISNNTQFKSMLNIISILYGLNLDMLFGKLAVYDFDPKLSKRAIPLSGKKNLEFDGSNLTLVLRGIITDERRRSKFFNLLNDLLPHVNNIDVNHYTDNLLVFTLEEKFIENKLIPASFLSDGTINITALLTALYFQDDSLAIFEEPERNIHPYLISRLTQMMEEVSHNKQIIISTHNPEFVKYANINDILLISRDQDGFSTITRPAEKEHVKIFLENEMGLDELFVQNLLGV